MSTDRANSILRSDSFHVRTAEFRRQIEILRPDEPARIQDKKRMNCYIHRNNYLEDAFTAFMSVRPEQLMWRLNVIYDGEQGLDWGGLTRDFFAQILPAITNPNYALFKTSEANPYAYQINPLSSVNPDHLSYFRFVGRILGKALFDNQIVTVYFTPTFYKKLIGFPCNMSDLEAEDPELYRSLIYLLDNDPAELDLTFTVNEIEFDVVKEIDLVPHGGDIPVTNENKGEFLKLIIEHKLSYKTNDQMDSVRRGFQDVFPLDLIRSFTPAELELLLCGTSKIDLEDWRKNTDYINFTPASPSIIWWWELLESMSQDDLAKLLQFVTGTTKVPSGGFASLIGATGPRRFTISKSSKDANSLPVSHTCFNQIDLPEYPSKQVFQKMMIMAINEGGSYFFDR